MSIIIPGMKMPKDGECIVVQSDGTAYKYDPGDVVMYGDAYNETAVAVQLPPHGDLMDREKIPFVEAEYACDDYAFRYDINEMTPVIPADPEKEDT